MIIAYVVLSLIPDPHYDNDVGVCESSDDLLTGARLTDCRVTSDINDGSVMTGQKEKHHRDRHSLSFLLSFFFFVSAVLI